ncbi:hypothetical protein GCM10023115_04320 [Pontixanthobacter gangjinensis]
MVDFRLTPGIDRLSVAKGNAMKARYLVSISASACALVAATPALAQPEMTYEQKPYEYAQAAPAQGPQPPPVTYRQEPVVQPAPQAMPQPVVYEREYEAEYEYSDAPHANRPHRALHAMPHHAMPAHGMPPMVAIPHHAYPQHPIPHQAQFDRGAWIEECVTRYNGGQLRRDRNGNIIGGLVGAVAGGVIGNRVAGRGDRLAGSLIGAGVGGLAGLAVGAAIDAATDDRGRDSEEAWAFCEDYLARYTHQNMGGFGYYAQPMMLVPVMIQVPQHAVVREYVTEETVHVQVVTYEDVPARPVVKPAPQPVKRVPIKSVPTKRVRSVKGN